MERLKKSNQGFTLVELLIVVLILGVLVSIAVTVYLSANKNAMKNTCKTNLRTIYSAQSTFAAANDGRYAIDIDELVDGDSLKVEPRCPAANAGTAGDYVVVGTPTGDTPFDVSCPNDVEHHL